MKKKKLGRPKQGPIHDPTPEEIAEETAKIRKDWTPHDYMRRTGIAVPKEYVEYETPTVKTPKLDQ